MAELWQESEGARERVRQAQILQCKRCGSRCKSQAPVNRAAAPTAMDKASPKRPFGSGRGGRGAPSEARKRAKRAEIMAQRAEQQSSQSGWMPDAGSIAAAAAAAAVAASMALRQAEAASRRLQAGVDKHVQHDKVKQLAAQNNPYEHYVGAMPMPGPPP